MAGPPRRRPYPFDSVLAGLPVMFHREVDEKGNLLEPEIVAEKAPTLEESAPTDFTYSAMSPLLEKVAPFGDLYLGFGQRVQQLFQDRRYRKALGVDVTGGTWVKGPDITTTTPATSGKIIKVWEQSGAIYAAADKYILKSTDGINWGAPIATLATTITDVIVFQTNAGGVVYSYIGVGFSNVMYRFDGTTATAHATLQAGYFAVVGREFYRTTGVNTLAKVDVDTDPWVAANWTNALSWTIGDVQYPITALSVTAGQGLLVHKTNGLFSLDPLGLDHPLYPFMQFGTDSEGGHYWFQFDNFVHVSYQESHYTIDASFQLHASGPNRSPTNDTEVYGRITAGSAHGEFGAYAMLWNPETNNSYLMKYGAWVMKQVSQFTGQDIITDATRISEWHGSLSLPFSGMKGTAMLRTSVGGPDANHFRMIIGFDNGQIASFILPCRPNPAACSQYHFLTSNGELYFPFWHGTFETENKSLRAATVESQFVDASNYVQIWYKTDPNLSSYTNIGSNFALEPRQKTVFPDNQVVQLADFKMVFVNATNQKSPQIIGWGLHHRMVLDLTQIFTFQVDCADRQVNRRGQPIHGYTAQYIRDQLTNAIKNAGSFQAIFADESLYSVGAVKFKETIKWSARLRKATTVMQISVIQFTSPVTVGTWDRVAVFTWDNIANYTWDQILGL